MADDETEKPAGSGYALVDWRLARIEAQLLTIASVTVPVAIYNVNQQNITEKFAELMKMQAMEEAIRAAGMIALHTRIDRGEERQETNRSNIEKSRKQLVLTVTAGILVAAINLFGTPIAQGIIGLVAHK